jgi:hypothetical protein
MDAWIATERGDARAQQASPQAVPGVGYTFLSVQLFLRSPNGEFSSILLYTNTIDWTRLVSVQVQLSLQSLRVPGRLEFDRRPPTTRTA